MPLKVTTAADYAIRAMVYVASFPESRWVLRSEIADAEAIPYSFTAKILRQLVHAGLLRSSRGAHGGFALARPAPEITLLQVFQAIEGPVQLLEDRPPGGTSFEPARAVWSEVERRVVDALGSVSLEALVSAPRRQGVVMFRPRAAGDAAALGQSA